MSSALVVASLIRLREPYALPEEARSGAAELILFDKAAL